MFRRRPSPVPAVQAYLATPRPDARLPWRAARYAVLDVETGGLDPRRAALLAVGLVEIADGRIRLERAWRSHIRPPADLPLAPEAIRIHGLLRSELAGAPSLTEVLLALLPRLAGRVLVVHVAALDVRFLDRALQAAFGIRLRGPVLDTARLAQALQRNARFTEGRAAEPDPPNLALRTLAERAGLPVYPEHDALNDALTTAQLFLSQAVRLEQQGASRLSHLLRAGACRR